MYIDLEDFISCIYLHTYMYVCSCIINSVATFKKLIFLQFYPSLTETPHEALLAKLQRAETGESLDSVHTLIIDAMKICIIHLSLLLDMQCMQGQK